MIPKDQTLTARDIICEVRFNNSTNDSIKFVTILVMVKSAVVHMKRPSSGLFCIRA